MPDNDDQVHGAPRPLPVMKVAAPGPLERRLYAGAAMWCCTSDAPGHPGSYLWRVGLVRTIDGYQPADPNDTACPECGTPGQQVSGARTWPRREGSHWISDG